MELTQYAAWLNDVFGLFDTFFLSVHHELAVSYGDILTPIANALGAAGHYGVMFGVLGVFLLIFRKTRLAGVAILFSVLIAGGLSEFVIKDIVARPRPFEMSETFARWWQFVGSPSAHSSSFPSGHVAAATAAMVALAYGARRWWASLLGVLLVAAMAIDRMYLQVHFPSDVLAGFILGFASGIVGYAIIQGIFRLLDQHPDQIAARKYEASRHAQMQVPRGPEMPSAQATGNMPSTQYGQVTIPRGAGMNYYDYNAPSSTGQMPQATAQQEARPAYAPSRYAQHAQSSTIPTAAGGAVTVPGVPVEQASPAETQLINMPAEDASNVARPTSDSGFELVEEYYQEPQH